MTDYRDFFKRAADAAEKKYPFSDDGEIIRSVKERARNMKKETGNKKNILLRLAAGSAAAVMLIGGAALCVSWLNEYGGLKEGGSAGSKTTYTALSAQNGESIDISGLTGKTFRFSDMSATVDSAGYDGQYIRLDITQTQLSGDFRGCFMLEPLTYKYTFPSDNGYTYVEREAADEATRKYTLVREYTLPTDESLELCPAYCGLNNTERVNDLTVTIHKDKNTLIIQPVSDGDDDISADGFEFRVGNLNISPLLTEIPVSYSNKGGGMLPKPEVSAVAADGNTEKLTCETAGSYLISDRIVVKYYCVPDDPALDLTQMKALSVNGRVYDITEAPFGGGAQTAVTTAVVSIAEDVPDASGSDSEEAAPELTETDELIARIEDIISMITESKTIPEEDKKIAINGLEEQKLRLTELREQLTGAIPAAPDKAAQMTDTTVPTE